MYETCRTREFSIRSRKALKEHPCHLFLFPRLKSGNWLYSFEISTQQPSIKKCLATLPPGKRYSSEVPSGLLGPDLSNIASTRSAETIQESLKFPSAFIEPGYAGVSVVTSEGQHLSGVLKNESNYSIQILDGEGNFHLLLTQELRELVRRKKSLMPTPSLPERELQDLQAYLSRQSTDAPTQEGNKTMHGKQVEP